MTEADNKPAIVLACHKLGLGVIRALGYERVPVVAVYHHHNDMGFVSKYAVAKSRCPNPETDEDGFLGYLESMAGRWAGSVLIPSDDGMLVATSKNKERLSRHFDVAAPDWQLTQTYVDKKHTYRLAQQIGVPCPRTAVPSSLTDALTFARQIGFPCLLKPSIGHRFYAIFKKKMLLVNDESQFAEAFEMANRTNVEMMVQEFIPGGDGHGANYNSFFVDNEPYVEFTARRIRSTPPRTGFPRVVVSQQLPELIESGRQIVGALNYEGFSCTEFKRDARDGVYKLMEINARQNLSGLLAVKCGINFPFVAYRHAGYGELPAKKNEFQEGVYWIDLEKDITESIRSYRRERYSFREYLRPYFKRHVFSVVSLKDPKPLLKRGLDTVNAVWKRIFVRGRQTAKEMEMKGKR